MVEAHAGLGKTELLRGAAERAGRSPVLRVVRFACGELERQLAWAAAVGLLEGELARLSPARRRRVLAGAAAPAATLLDGRTEPAPSDRDGHELVRGLFLVVARLAQLAPLALFLDDAHWCDEQSLRFLVYLQRRLDTLPVSLVVALRPPGSGEAAELRRHLSAAPGVRVVRLGPLGEASVAAVVRRSGFPAAGEDFCRACRAATGGNPLYLRELLGELRRRGTQEVPSDLTEIAPASIARVVLARLSHVPGAGAAAFARAAAVLGDGAPLRHVAALAGLDRAEAARLADAVAGHQLIAPGEPVRFVHPLVRAALRSAIPAAERALLHRRAADMLAGEEAAPEVVALHLLHAPREAADETVTTLRAAAAAALGRGGSREAAAYLRRALAEPPPVAARADVLAELARAEAAAGEPSAADHLRAALELTAEPRRRAELLLELGLAEHHAGRFAAAAGTFERAQQLAADDPDLSAALEAGFLLSAFLERSRSAEAQGRIAAIAARPPADHGPAQRGLLAQVLFARLMAGEPHGEILDLAVRLWDGGRLLAQEGPDSQTLWHVVGTLSWADDLATATAATDAALQRAAEEGLALATARGRYARAWPRYWSGDLLGAAEDAGEAIEIWHGGLETYLPAAVYWRVLALLELDEPDEAERALALAGSLQRWEGTAFAGFLLAARAELAGHRGRPEQALADHLACGRVAEAMHFRNPAIMPWRSRAALAARLAGELDTARALAAEELELAARFGAPRAHGVALRSAGLVAEASEAVPLLARSVAVLERSAAALEHARSLIELGAAVRRGHRRAEARRYLTGGLAIAERAGAAGLVRRAVTELAAAGGRAGRGGRGGPAGRGRSPEPADAVLTASERRVAELAASGHTNAEIARALHVSVKAVEWHLHQTYRKLDIRSRHQLAGALPAVE